VAAFSLTELLFVAGLVATLGGIATAEMHEAIDEARAAGAVRYLAGRLHDARLEAIARGSATAVRILSTGGSYRIASYIDGNGDGVLSADIQNGVDVEYRASERLPDRFTGVDFGTVPGLPAVDANSTPPGADPIRLGVVDGVTFTPLGTSSTGSLYLLGPGARQFVVRIFGDTGKTRLLRFNTRSWTWMTMAWE
jgi:hypothetical protein